MKLFGFIFGKQPQPEAKRPNIFASLLRGSLGNPKSGGKPALKEKGLRCACCHERIRKGDKHTVLTVKHKDCGDRKRNALPKALDEQLDAL